MESQARGWLLDLYEDEQDGVRLWFILDDHSRICLHWPLPVTFYVFGPPERLHAVCLAVRGAAGLIRQSRAEKTDVFKPEPLSVLRLEMDNPVRQRRLFQQLKQKFPDLIYYDADLGVHIHHAAKHGTFPMALCDLRYDAETGELFNLAVRNERWDIFPLEPPLRVLSIRPDCDPKKKDPVALIFEQAGHGQVLRMREPDRLMERLNTLIRKTDPDLILTEWGDDWLFPLLQTFEEKTNIPLLINRDAQRRLFWRKEVTYFSYGQTIHRERAAHLFGRCHIDTRNATMWRDYGLDGTLESARVTTLPIEQSARVSSGSGISAMQMITALERGVLVPEQKQQIEAEKNGLALIRADRGGLVYQPKIGLHVDVAQIDFTSMYPAVIINGNISPEIPLPDGLMPTSTELGVVPQTLKPLYEKRVELKFQLAECRDKSTPEAARLRARLSALKWLLVVCFGFLGYKNARFGKIEAHEAVTRGGREALLIAKEVCEAHGFEVLHLFVDALWIRRSGCRHKDDYQQVLIEIAERTKMKINLDGIFRWIAFLPSRGNDAQPVPNRYFGVFQDGALKIRGIESRRGDLPVWVAETQLEMLSCLAKASDARQLPDYLPQAFRIFHAALASLNAGQIPLEQLVLTCRISQELEAYKSRTPVVRAALQLLERTGKRTGAGQKVRFLYTLDDVYAWDQPGYPDPERIDRRRYRELLARAAGSVLYSFGIPQKQLSDYAQGELQFPLMLR